MCIRDRYGIYQAKAAIVKADCVYMVEGYTDVLAVSYTHLLASTRVVAALCTPHCNTCVAPDVRAVLI